MLGSSRSRRASRCRSSRVALGHEVDHPPHGGHLGAGDDTVLDGRTQIGAEHLRAALAVWRYCDDSARYEFGDAVGDPVADELLEALRSRPDGMTRTEVRDLLAGTAAAPGSTRRSRSSRTPRWQP
jgi:hypothetical protein